MWKKEKDQTALCVQLFSICTQNSKNSNYFLVKTVKAKRAPVTISASVVLHILNFLYFLCVLFYLPLWTLNRTFCRTHSATYTLCTHRIEFCEAYMWAMHHVMLQKKMVIRWWIWWIHLIFKFWLKSKLNTEYFPWTFKKPYVNTWKSSAFIIITSNN